MKWFVVHLVMLRLSTIMAVFYPNTRNVEAYGIRIAANDRLFAQANSDDQTWLVQLAPYNDTRSAFRCVLNYPDPAHYIYTVSVGCKPNVDDAPFFYYAGEVVPIDSTGADRSGETGTFIAVMINRLKGSKLPSWCSYFKPESIAYLSSYGHQEHFVVAVEPYGQYAIGVATDFIFRYDPFLDNMMTNVSTRTIWPNGSVFHPCAADASEVFTVVAGFVENAVQSRVRATPTVYVISNDDLTVLSSWSYEPDESSWQSYLTYTGFESWTSKLTMSAKINGNDSRQVLVGMPFLDTAFLLVALENGTYLVMVSAVSGHESVGFGKGVAWLSNTQAAILYAEHSRDYADFIWSRICIYALLDGPALSSSASAVIPNAQQPLPSTIKSRLIQLISTPSTVGILDRAGGVMLILSEAPGSYASTGNTKSSVDATMPAISYSRPCMAGTFKAGTGVHPCTPCPIGSRNSGNNGAVICIPCSADTFCPLGAVGEVDRAYLSSLSQVNLYPRSPEVTVYEDLLINNMVAFGATFHCRRISPLFWTVVLLLIAAVLLLGMASLNLCVNEPTRDRWRTRIKSVFLRTDLVVSSTLQEMWEDNL